MDANAAAPAAPGGPERGVSASVSTGVSTSTSTNAGASTSANASTVKPKQRRVTQACDYCHQRSIRCRPSGDGPVCHNCKDFDQACTYHRKPRRRGVQPRPASRTGTPGAAVAATVKAEPVPDLLRHLTSGSDSASTSPLLSVPYRGPNPARARQDAWEPPFIATQATIVDLVELYFEIVYPIFPFFHQPSFTRRISRADYMTNRTLFATTMAVCALVSSRIRDGSVTNPRWNLDSLRDPSPDVFYGEAKRQLIDVSSDSSLDVLRAHAILSIAAIQNSKVRDMHQHLGTYHTLVAMDALHDESNWPAGIGLVEKEERRRLFWSIYTLDIYTSVVWGGIIRSREQLSNVAYPMEVDDEFINDSSDPQADHSPTSVSSSSTRRALTVQSDCWLSGWNFITDLYRVLEHALTRFRYHSNRSRRQAFLHEIFEDKSTSVTEASVRNSVLQMYLNLPPCFKETPQVTYNVKKDRFGFQAANITGSLQLVRMVLFAAGGASIDERCQIVREVVDAFISVPVTYLIAISTPLLYHLGGIGAFLGSVFEEPLSEADYAQVRSIMLSLARLLETLEAKPHSTSASVKLRSQVARIDEYMTTQRQLAPPLQLPDSREVVVPTQAVAAGDRNVGGGSYQQMGPDMNEGWSFQVPAEMLGELSWNLDFGQSGVMYR